MKPLRHLHALYNGEVALAWQTEWPCLIVIAGIVALTGPLVFLAFAIQDWCAAPSWDAEDRWRGTRAFALTFLVVALLLVLFRGFFLQLWPPTLGALFWYPIFWWGLCLLLSPTLALLAERVDPRTRPLERILLPDELAGQHQQRVMASTKKATRSKSTRKQQDTVHTREMENVSPSPRRPKTKRDPRPIYQAWAVQPPVLPPAPGQGTTRPPGPKRDKRDEGESLADIF